MAASRSRTVYNVPFHAHGGRRLGFGSYFQFEPAYAASYVVPSILFEDVSLRRPGREAPRLPLTDPPWEP